MNRLRIAVIFLCVIFCAKVFSEEAEIPPAVQNAEEETFNFDLILSYGSLDPWKKSSQGGAASIGIICVNYAPWFFGMSGEAGVTPKFDKTVTIHDIDYDRFIMLNIVVSGGYYKELLPSMGIYGLGKFGFCILTQR